MKKIILLFTLFLIAGVAFGQRANQKWYRTALGARFEFGGDEIGSIGVSLDRFITNQTSIEIFVLTDLETGAELNAFFKYIKPFPEVPATLRWYAGIGLEGSAWKGPNVGRYGDAYGFAGLLGAGYSFRDIPFNITVDWHPVYNLKSTYTSAFLPARFGLTGRYIIE